MNMLLYIQIGLLTDENLKRRHVDTNLWSIVPKVVFNYMRNPDRDLSHSGHDLSRRISPREYVAKDPLAVVLVTPRENATIACIGESVNSYSQIFISLNTVLYCSLRLNAIDQSHTIFKLLNSKLR